MPKCVLCETRKPRRYCPAKNGDICAQCCGTSREVTLACPFDCDYLREARIHEKLVDVDPATFPHQDIEITESLLVSMEPVLLACAAAVAEGAIEANAYDSDVLEALESLIRSYRTKLLGLIYDAVPENGGAAGVLRRARGRIDDYRDRVAKETARSPMRESDLIGALVFLQRMALDNDNQRAKSRRFIDILRIHFAVTPKEGGGPQLIV